jgi:hypothetical protein
MCEQWRLKRHVDGVRLTGGYEEWKKVKKKEVQLWVRIDTPTRLTPALASYCPFVSRQSGEGREMQQELT